MSPHRLLILTFLVAACSGGGDAGPEKRRITALDQSSQCTGLSATECDSGLGCAWVAIDVDCMEGAPCPDGACVAIDPCGGHTDPASCAGAAIGCEWSQVDLLCPPGQTCPNDGYCHLPTGDGCACLCPAAPCVVGPDGREECPPCECDCDDDCDAPPPTCTCPACPPGADCPQSCVCDEPISGGGSGPGGDSGGGATADEAAPQPICEMYSDPETCNSIAACQWNEAPCLPEGECPGSCSDRIPVDPCSVHGDEASCNADTALGCDWVSSGDCGGCAPGGDCAPCDPTTYGSCHSGLPDDGCVCVCPGMPCTVDSDGNVSCPVCDCTCDGGGGGECSDPIDGGPGGGSDPGGVGGGSGG